MNRNGGIKTGRCKVSRYTSSASFQKSGTCWDAWKFREASFTREGSTQGGSSLVEGSLLVVGPGSCYLLPGAWWPRLASCFWAPPMRALVCNCQSRMWPSQDSTHPTCPIAWILLVWCSSIQTAFLELLRSKSVFLQSSLGYPNIVGLPRDCPFICQLKGHVPYWFTGIRVASVWWQGTSQLRHADVLVLLRCHGGSLNIPEGLCIRFLFCPRGCHVQGLVCWTNPGLC